MTIHLPHKIQTFYIVNDYILCVPDKMIAEHSVKYRKAVKVLIGIRPI